MIERGVFEALKRAPHGSKQERQAEALKVVLEAVKADGFQDVPLSSKEQLVDVEGFPPEMRKALEEEGYQVYALRGVSIRTLRGEGRRFGYVNSIFEDPTSTLESGVAIRKGLFLPKSFNKLPGQQIKMVEEFSRRLENKIPGVQAIVADEPSVWAEIYHLHFEATGDVLFGFPGFFYTITRAHAGSGFAVFGSTYVDSWPSVDAWHPENRSCHVGVAPLVVPK